MSTVRSGWLRVALTFGVAVGLVATAGQVMASTRSGDAGAAIKVTRVSPRSGPAHGGTRVTVHGAGFRSPAATCGQKIDVAFGAQAGDEQPQLARSVHVLSDTTLTAVSPASYSGPVEIQVGNACHQNAPGQHGRFTYEYVHDHQCLKPVCKLSIGRPHRTTIRHIASGLLNGHTQPASRVASRRVDRLHPTSWRVGNSNPRVIQAVNRATRSSSLILESDYLTCNSCGWVLQPWTNLAGFKSFITQDVQTREANHTAPKYWDVWNEPDSGAGSVDQWLSVYGAAYKAIKAADPQAKVIGPSLGSFRLQRAEHPSIPGEELDLRDFLRYANAHHYRFAAISYHDEGNAGGAPIFAPQQLARHAAKLRSLLGRYASLRHAKIFVNEYGPLFAMSEPGWAVGDMAALEDSHVAEANFTCPTTSACDTYFDGLLGNGGVPQMEYWAFRRYAAMTGHLVRTRSSGSNITGLTTRHGHRHALRSLIGRHDECGVPPRPYVDGPVTPTTCPTVEQSKHGRATTALVNAHIPWRARHVVVRVRLLRYNTKHSVGDNPVVHPPHLRRFVVRVRHHHARFAVRHLHDGDAAALTILR